MLTQHKSYVYLHIIWNSTDIHLFVFTFFVPVCVFLSYLTNFLHDKMTAMTSQNVKNDWNLHFIKFKSELIGIINLMGISTTLSRDMTMISYSCLSLYIEFLRIWYSSACLNFSSSSAEIFSGALKCFLLVFFYNCRIMCTLGGHGRHIG